MGHSPPRIAPDIDLWGLETMAEWLRGFTEADFSVLDSMKDNLKGALGALVDLGVIDEELSADMYVNISADLIGAIEEFNRTGVMTAVIFEQLSTVSGVFGEELVTLLNMQLELAAATERVTFAQEAYNAAVEATKQSTHLVNSSIREYNALLRAGTDNSILEQRLAEINAAEMQLALDREMEAAAEAELQAAEDALDPLEEMVALQEQLIQQLIDLAEAQAEAAEAAADAIRAHAPDVIMPFPGGICRAGSKAGSLKYKMKASTNHPYCPTLKTIVPDSVVPDGVQCVYEIVINGLTLDAVKNAVKQGVTAAASTPGVVKISAGNYGGKLGPYKAFLKEALEAT
jgi:hypothetical protein